MRESISLIERAVGAPPPRAGNTTSFISQAILDAPDGPPAASWNARSRSAGDFLHAPRERATFFPTAFDGVMTACDDIGMHAAHSFFSRRAAYQAEGDIN